MVFGLLQIEPYLKGEPTRLLLEVRLGSDAAQQTTFKATRTTRTPPRSTPSASQLNHVTCLKGPRRNLYRHAADRRGLPTHNWSVFPLGSSDLRAWKTSMDRVLRIVLLVVVSINPPGGKRPETWWLAAPHGLKYHPGDAINQRGRR